MFDHCSHPKIISLLSIIILEIGSWSGTSWKISELGTKSPRTTGSEGHVLARQFWFLVLLLGVIRRAEGNPPNITASWRLQRFFMQKVIEGRAWYFTEKSTLALQYHHSDLHKVSALAPWRYSELNLKNSSEATGGKTIHLSAFSSKQAKPAGAVQKFGLK